MYGVDLIWTHLLEGAVDKINSVFWWFVNRSVKRDSYPDGLWFGGWQWEWWWVHIQIDTTYGLYIKLTSLTWLIYTLVPYYLMKSSLDPHCHNITQHSKEGEKKNTNLLPHISCQVTKSSNTMRSLDYN